MCAIPPTLQRVGVVDQQGDSSSRLNFRYYHHHACVSFPTGRLPTAHQRELRLLPVTSQQDLQPAVGLVPCLPAAFWQYLHFPRQGERRD